MDQIDYTNIVLEQLAYDFLTEEERTKLENDMSDESFEKEYYDENQDIGVKPKVGSVMLGWGGHYTEEYQIVIAAGYNNQIRFNNDGTIEYNNDKLTTEGDVIMVLANILKTMAKQVDRDSLSSNKVEPDEVSNEEDTDYGTMATTI
jgi:hypothetical protein